MAVIKISPSAFQGKAVSNSIFAARREQKTEDDVTNAPLLLGQSVSACRELGPICKTAQILDNSFEAYCDSSKAFSKPACVVRCISKHINPAIYATTAVQIVMADDKEEALAEKGSGVFVMRVAEETAKSAIGGKGEEIAYKMYNLTRIGASNSTKSIEKDIAKVLEKSKDKKMKIAGIAIEGVTLVAASITGYGVGAKGGKEIHDCLKNKGDALERYQNLTCNA